MNLDKQEIDIFIISSSGVQTVLRSCYKYRISWRVTRTVDRDPGRATVRGWSRESWGKSWSWTCPPWSPWSPYSERTRGLARTNSRHFLRPDQRWLLCWSSYRAGDSLRPGSQRINHLGRNMCVMCNRIKYQSVRVVRHKLLPFPMWSCS